MQIRIRLNYQNQLIHRETQISKIFSCANENGSYVFKARKSGSSLKNNERSSQFHDDTVRNGISLYYQIYVETHNSDRRDGSRDQRRH